MNRAVRRLFVTLVGAGILVASAAVSRPDAAGIEVRTRVSADSVTVGERLDIVYEVAFPDTLSFLPPETFDTGNCRLLSVTWKEGKADGRLARTARLGVMTTDLEKAIIPPVTFAFTTPDGDTLTAESGRVDVGVRRLAKAGDEPKPLKPQWEAPRSWAFLLIIAGAAVLGVIALWLVRRLRRRRGVVRVSEPELPADFVALQRLDEIERMNLLEAGDYKRHYTLVIDALRVYVEKRYGVLAMDQTTDEILWALRAVGAGTEEIEPMLREADLVKFAKHRPEPSSMRGLIDRARAYVARTAVRPLIEAGTA